MNPLKRLAGQTAVYGLSSILGRFLGYLLVPLYTRVFQQYEYGTVIELYSYVAVFLVILTYGMETAFFRFSEKYERKKVFGTALNSILSSSSLFLILIVIFNSEVANLIKYPENGIYIIYVALVLFFDSINTIPFAKLRADNKAGKFVTIKLLGIFSNIALNLILLLLIPFLLKTFDSQFIHKAFSFWNEADRIDYILFSNVFSSALQTILFLPVLLKTKLSFELFLLKKMLFYAFPLLIFGLAGVLNEMLDRILLKYLLPENIAMSQVGIYGAVYKVAMLMTIFTQAFRYAAEPFFFQYEKEKDSKEIYARLLNYFVIISGLIFLGAMLYIDIVILFIGEEFRVGKHVIPILLFANIFLGIYYNLSIWYKLTNKTKYGAILSFIGLSITVALNIYWIPKIGYLGSAWATFVCYASMMLLSFIFGRKFYPVKYNYPKIIFYLLTAYLIYLLTLQFDFEAIYLKYIVNTFLILFYLAIAFVIERKTLLVLKK